MREKYSKKWVWTLLELLSVVTPWWAQTDIFLMAAHSLVSINERVVLNACAYLLYVKEKEKQHKKTTGVLWKGKMATECISHAKSKNSAPFPHIFFFSATFFPDSSLQAISITCSSLLSDVQFIPVVSLPSMFDKFWASSGSKAVWWWFFCCWASVLTSQLPVARSIWSVSCSVGTVAVFNITCMFHAWNLSFSLWKSCSAEAEWPGWLPTNTESLGAHSFPPHAEVWKPAAARY